MQTYLNIAQIILSAAVIVAVLFQIKGGGLGGIFGQADTVYRSKRGAEKTLFQLTIVLFALFIIISIIAVSIGQ
jgi:preprotein translocase subunit SecG